MVYIIANFIKMHIINKQKCDRHFHRKIGFIFFSINHVFNYYFFNVKYLTFIYKFFAFLHILLKYNCKMFCLYLKIGKIFGGRYPCKFHLKINKLNQIITFLINALYFMLTICFLSGNSLSFFHIMLHINFKMFCLS